jgi:hypothetical protein
MFKKVIYIIICLILFVNIYAQQNVSNTLNSIRGNIDNILKDSPTLSDTCIQKIKQLKNILPPANSGSLKRAAMDKLLKDTKKITGSINTNKPPCNDTRIKNLLSSSQQLIMELEKLNRDTVMVKIKVIDSTNKSLNSELTIEDSSGIATIAVKDSTGNFRATLFQGALYSLKVKSNSYALFDTTFTTKKVKNESISIQMHIIDFTSLTQNSPSDTTRISTSKSEDSNESSVQNKLILIGMPVLFSLTLMLVILSFINYKNYRSVIKITNGLAAQLQNPQLPIMEEINKNPEVAELTPIQNSVQSNSQSEEKKEMVADNTKTDSYFMSEIMMTAGPRKKPTKNDPVSDKDLGEDICGFISSSKEVLIWLLDGTSDSHSLRNPENKQEYFSSRLLAQSLADNLRKNFIEKPDMPLEKQVDKAVQEVRLNWQQSINQLPPKERENLKNNIKNKNFPQCSTTVLIGHLNLNGDFIGYRSGDSKMLLFKVSPTNEISFSEKSFLDKNDESDDRVFFNLDVNDNGEFFIRTNHLRFQTITDDNIKTIISFSDGIGANTEQLLKEEYKNEPDKVKKDISYHLQGTGDDKSICFIERKEKQVLL